MALILRDGAELVIGPAEDRIRWRLLRMRFGAGIRIVMSALLLASTAAASYAQSEFPFERELLMDEKPMPGSKRVPILEIRADGRAQVDLWCRSGPAQVTVSGGSVTFTLGPLVEQGCTPERIARDDELAAALAQVTGWRMDEDVIVFAGGPTPLQFRLSTH